MAIEAVSDITFNGVSAFGSGSSGSGTQAFYQAWTATSGQIAYTVSQTDLTSNGTIVSINGLIQKPDTDYVISGTTLTLAVGAILGDIVEVRVPGSTVNSNPAPSSNANITLLSTISLPASTIDFSNISQDYSDLKIVFDDVKLSGTDSLRLGIRRSVGNYNAAFTPSITNGYSLTGIFHVPFYKRGTMNAWFLFNISPITSTGAMFNSAFSSGNSMMISQVNTSVPITGIYIYGQSGTTFISGSVSLYGIK